jgi:hypothetical protein
VPLAFGAATPAAAAPDTFVAAREGRIALLSARTGDVVRWLTEQIPGGGAPDPQLSEDRTTVVYSQGAGTCSSEIRSVPVSGGAPTTLVDTTHGVVSLPSRRGDAFAYYRSTCADGSTYPDATHEIVTVVSRHQSTIPVDGAAHGIVVGERFLLYVTEKDGATLLHMPDLYGELADSPTAPPSGCQWAAATWGPRDANDREQVVAAARCPTKDDPGNTVLYRLDADGRNRTEIGRMAAVNVRWLDYDASRTSLLLGMSAHVGGDECATVYGDPPRDITCAAWNPTW